MCYPIPDISKYDLEEEEDIEEIQVFQEEEAESETEEDLAFSLPNRDLSPYVIIHNIKEGMVEFLEIKTPSPLMVTS